MHTMVGSLISETILCSRVFSGHLITMSVEKKTKKSLRDIEGKEKRGN